MAPDPAAELVKKLDATNAELLKALRQKRGVIKARLTRTITKCEDILTMDEGLLETHKSLLEKINQDFMVIQAEIEDKFLEIEDLCDSRESFEVAYISVYSKIKQQIIRIQNTNQVPAQVMYNQVPQTRSIKAPIPTFDGDIRNWVNFKTRFSGLVVDDATQSDAGRFALLEHSVSGLASDIVSSNNTTFVTAWSKLDEYYTNDVYLKEILIADLYNVAAPKVYDSASILAFAHEIQHAIAALTSAGMEPMTWEPLMIHHLYQRLDSVNVTELERYRTRKQLISYKEFIEFLMERSRLLEKKAPASFVPNSSSTPRQNDPRKASKEKSFSIQDQSESVAAAMSSSKRCMFCDKPGHGIWKCFAFQKLPVQQREDKVKTLKVCSNCLGASHSDINDCKSEHSCKHCGKRHHSTLCPAPQGHDLNESGHEVALSALQSESKSIVLATAVVFVETINGTKVPARALLDSGSTLNFMTTALAQKLGLKLIPAHTQITGISEKKSVSTSSVAAIILSRKQDYTSSLIFAVTRKVVGNLPLQKIDPTSLNLPPNVFLADPSFDKPAGIDMLLGAETFFDILLGNKILLIDQLWLYESKLGSLIAGGMNNQQFKPEPVVHHSFTAIHELKALMQLFWESESLSGIENYSLEERAAENHYSQHVQHLENGHYQVALPFKENVDLGRSSDRAKHVFLAAERRRAHDKARNNAYCEFMREMVILDHMGEVKVDFTKPHYFMSHHILERSTSLTTKWRVVFNASFKTSTKKSLNDFLMVGPTIQAEVFSHLIHWRQFEVALTADITKMYRQISIRPEDRVFQLIWWRESAVDELKSYALKTVTYGTASAPFQATRTLKQLAMDEVSNYPTVAPHFQNNMYVDDYIASFPTIQAAREKKEAMTELAAKGGFELRKWSSNVSEFDDELTKNEPVMSVLGVTWDKPTDNILISFSRLSLHDVITRAHILSEIAQMFDPLGLCAPVVLTAKIFMQTLWQLSNVTWDDELPTEVVQKWLNFRNQLVEMAAIGISRALITTVVPFTIHGFADASEDGYGACIYLVSSQNSKLICSKSRVAPLKRLSMPRLELNAALLLAQLLSRVLKSLEQPPVTIFCWSDSEITIHRIKNSPARFNIYVGVRVAEIQQLTEASDWKYVPSTLNPADIVSRGLMPADLAMNDLWWTGPNYVRLPNDQWPSQEKFQKYDINEDDELKKEKLACVALELDDLLDTINTISSFSCMVKALARCIRFFLNAKKPKKYRNFQPLHVSEVMDAELRLFRLVQNRAFPLEVKLLNKHQKLPNSSRLLSLNPFIDEDGLLRVGGRLANSTLSFDHQHQIIIDGGKLAEVFLRDLHRKNCHCGPQLLLATSRQKLWIVGGRSLTRKVVHDCVICFRQRPKLLQQIMGQLPAARLSSAHAFETTGVDYAGPFYIRPQPRARALWKVYVAVFTCFFTRATHLELVQNLTTTAFLDSFRRFISRRGIPSDVWSDNGTNLVGGRNELKELRNLLVSDDHITEVKEFCSENRINWRHIPPRSPHWGGLWESAVKQFKHHLQVTAHNHIFDWPGLETVVCQIEAVLNSRPLTPVSRDGDDFDVLTPGHFLVGRPLNLLPEPCWADMNFNRLDAWQQRQCMVGRLWTRFQAEYIAELQKRTKWTTTTPDIQLDQIVLIHEDHLPPCRWKYGKIIE